MSPNPDTKDPQSKVRKEKTAHVHLGDEKKDVPAGEYVVRDLKQALAVAPEAALYLKERGRLRLLADHETIEVKSGLKFEAVTPGGVS